MNNEQCKCSECGRFCSWDSDVGTPFGGYYDYEPPDDKFFCAECAKRLEKYYVEQKWVPTYWCKPKWSLRVAERLGYVQIRRKGAAWTQWHNNAKPMPEGWQTT